MQFVTKLLVVFVSLILVAGCAGTPVYNVSGAPVETNSKDVSLDSVHNAIRRAGASLGWQMKTIKPGLMVGTLNLRNHSAVVDVAYNTKSYNITYKDSANLKYDGTSIHKNYNAWVQNLDNKIRVELSTL